MDDESTISVAICMSAQHSDTDIREGYVAASVHLPTLPARQSCEGVTWSSLAAHQATVAAGLRVQRVRKVSGFAVPYIW